MRRYRVIHILSMAVVVLLVIITLCGVFSWDISKSFDTVNKYGETIKLLSVLVTGIVIVGAMMTFQTGFQIAAGVDVPVPALITKSLIFLLLGIYAFILAKKLYNNMEEKI